MDLFELNKVLGALRNSAWCCLPFTSPRAPSSRPPCRPSPAISSRSRQEGTAKPKCGGTAAPAEQPIEALLATGANTKNGQETAKECELCHNLGKGQGAKIGPDLYGVVGRPVATEAGFGYSAPLKAKGGTWTFDALNKWLTNPRADVPGTLMTFAGISNAHQRADVIAYLNSNSDKPLPLPKAAEAKPAGGAPASASAGAKPPAPAAAAPAAPAAPAPAAPAK